MKKEIFFPKDGQYKLAEDWHVPLSVRGTKHPFRHYSKQGLQIINDKVVYPAGIIISVFTSSAGTSYKIHKKYNLGTNLEPTSFFRYNLLGIDGPVIEVP